MLQLTPEQFKQSVYSKILPVTECGCWFWLGGVHEDGYGYAHTGPRTSNALVHRLVYEWEVGPIPDGLDLHHKCETPLCCNPKHLQPTTKANHMMELTPKSIFYQKARQEACIRGHVFDEANTRIATFKRGDKTYSRRDCRECDRLKAAAARRRKRLET